MRIAVIALGTQGDVQPYIALGAALGAAGHAVRLLTHETFQAAVTTAGLEFWPARGDVRAATQTPEMRALLEKGNFLEITRHAARLSRAASLDWARDGLVAAAGVDLLVAGIGGLYLGRALSEKLGIGLLEAHVVPFTPTREFPGAVFPAAVSRLGGTANRLSHRLFRQVMWQGSRGGDRAAREEVLGLPPAPFFGPRPSRKRPRPPVLYGISPHVLPKPADWGADIHLTGYWFLDAAPDWQPPAALSAFLEAGPPPVYVGFGSMGNPDPERTGRLVLEALRLTGRRAVLLSGWGGFVGGALPDTVYLGEAVPHAWLFPRMSVVVHHGGAGTTAAGLRAGVPSIVVPFFGDQPFWGRRVRALGVGPAPIPRRALTAENLASALRAATTDQAMGERAARLGELVRAERGSQNAARLIEGYGRRLGLT